VYRFPVRFRGIDAPEMKGGSQIECQKAIVSRDALHSLIFGQIIELRNNAKEKYGRLLSDIYRDDLHVNKWMLDQKYAVAYNGKGTKEDWSVV
jgi:endonuclease YncB( thermonuclease family)